MTQEVLVKIIAGTGALIAFGIAAYYFFCAESEISKWENDFNERYKKHFRE